MPEAKKWAIAYWLLPAAASRNFFREIIRRLAAKYDAPGFDPHLTLVVGPDSSVAAQEKLAKLPGGLVELRPLEVAWATAFTKTLFVRFRTSSLLRQLRSSLGMEDDRGFDPHLSLLYKKIPAQEQARLAAGIELPFGNVTFDAVAAMRCRLPVATAAAVAVWKSVGSRRLVD